MNKWVARSTLIVFLCFGVFAISRSSGVQEWIRSILQSISEIGFLGAIIFIPVYILSCILFIPGSLLTLGAGFAFGVFEGTILVSIASTLGAAAAFLIGRYFARNWVAQKAAVHPKFKALDDAVGREGWKIVLLTRLSPIFPFNLLNYFYGLTKLSLGPYVLSSWVGMIPGTILYVYLGSLAGSLATLNEEGRTRSPVEWLFFSLGLGATVLVTVYVTRLAQASLNKKIES